MLAESSNNIPVCKASEVKSIRYSTKSLEVTSLEFGHLKLRKWLEKTKL